MNTGNIIIIISNLQKCSKQNNTINIIIMLKLNPWDIQGYSVVVKIIIRAEVR